ncbi:MAG: S-methyl-5'-thioadenosine phosphorylase, partial [Armatimonadetes bacterium]|nr:S-methyl-5'-thioadenosine phosphorylase [Armatimonadota bacterium]
GVPEVVLAREAEICYASVGVVTNYAAGISGQVLSADEVHKLMGQIRPDLLALLTEAIARLDPDADCLCPFK